MAFMDDIKSSAQIIAELKKDQRKLDEVSSLYLISEHLRKRLGDHMESCRNPDHAEIAEPLLKALNSVFVGW